MLRVLFAFSLVIAGVIPAGAMDVTIPLQASFAGDPVMHVSCDHYSRPKLSLTLDHTFSAFGELPDVVILAQHDDAAFVAHASAYRQPDGKMRMNGELDRNRDLADFVDLLRLPEIPPIMIVASAQSLQLPTVMSRTDGDRIVQQFDAECAGH